MVLCVVREPSLAVVMSVIRPVSKCDRCGMDALQGVCGYACVKLGHWLVKLLLIPASLHIWHCLGQHMQGMYLCIAKVHLNGSPCPTQLATS